MSDLARSIWRTGGVWYLAVCVLGLAAGLWPDAVYPREGVVAAPLPTLHTLAAAQVAYFLLIRPVLVSLILLVKMKHYHMVLYCFKFRSPAISGYITFLCITCPYIMAQGAVFSKSQPAIHIDAHFRRLQNANPISHCASFVQGF